MKTKKGVLARMLTYTRPYGIYLVFALVFAVLQVLLTLYAPVLSGRAVDFIVGPGNVDFPAIGEILIQFAVVILLSAGFQWLMALCTNIVTGNTVRDIREAAFGKLETIPLSYIDGAARGDLMSRVVTDVDMISDGLLQGFSQLFTGVVTVFGTIGFMLSLSPAIAAVVVVLTPVSLFVSSFIARGVSRSFREQSTIRGRLGGFVEEMLGSQSVVKAFGYEQRAQARFDEVNEHLNKVGLRAQFFSAMVNPCTRFVNGLVYAAVGIFGALRVIAGGLSVGGLSAFLVYANQYTKPFNEISGVIAELQSAIAGARRVFELLDVEPEPPDAPDAVALESCAGRVELDDVSFSYRRDEKLIEHMSFAVEPGQRIAIVGPTGCGKTTLINLLMRFYDVNSGAITVDGTDVRGITRRSLRHNYGMVLQETWLKAGTIRENLLMACPDATDEQMVEAAKAAHAHGFITRLPQGYDTPIGEDGGLLSQGQKQLLCIARIMLRLPPMLILDEATSSIDTRTEIRIQQAFNHMMQGRTTFVVAHRLSTIRDADVILVMKDGHVVEQGNHEQLLQKNGFYATLYNSQFALAD